MLAEAIDSDDRPWGRWEEYISEPGYRVKRLIVDPAKRISLQKHQQRSEHWVIVSGQGQARIGDQIRDISVGDVVFIPPQTIHRLSNTGDIPLIVVETQLGICLENDIIRIEDDFNRS